MKSLFLRIYDLLTAPAYRKLSRDLTLQLQNISRDYIDYHDKVAAKYIDELVKVNMRLDALESLSRGEAPPAGDEKAEGNGAPTQEIEDTRIYDAMRQLKKSKDVIEISQRFNLPVSTIVDWHNRYRDLDVAMIRRVRVLEDTNFELQRIVTELTKENRNLKELATLRK